MRKYFLTCIFLCAGLLIKAEESSIFRYPDSLYLAGKYRIAAIEYERIAYKAQSNIIYAEALLKKSECFVSLNNFTDAVRILSRVNFYELPEELLAKVYYKTALYAYLGKDFANAELQLMQMEFFVENKALAQESRFLFVLVLNELKKWPEAKGKLLEFIDNSNFTQQQVVEYKKFTEEIYSEDRIPNLKSIEKAQNLSSFLPGTGQIYAGYFLEGITNAGFQILSLGLTAYGIYAKYYITSLAVGFAFFQKFYAGALPRLEYLVNKKNYELTREYNTELKAFVLDVNEKASLPE